jgi:hypothetical protein
MRNTLTWFPLAVGCKGFRRIFLPLVYSTWSPSGDHAAELMEAPRHMHGSEDKAKKKTEVEANHLTE